MSALSVTQALSTGPSKSGCSAKTCWDRCRQEYAYRYVLNIVPQREDEAPALGTMIHIALMHLYRMSAGLDYDDPVEAMRAAPARISWTFERALRIFQCYLTYWAAVDNQIDKVLAVEHELDVEVYGRRHTQRVDRICAYKGRVWFDDHKTASRGAKSQQKAWNMTMQFISMQLLGETLSQRLWGLPFGGCRVNAIGTQADPDFGIFHVDIKPSLVAPLAKSVVAVADEMKQYVDANIDPWEYRRSYGACKRFWGEDRARCDYADLCRYGKEGLRAYDHAIDIGTTIGG